MSTRSEVKRCANFASVSSDGEDGAVKRVMTRPLTIYTVVPENLEEIIDEEQRKRHK